MSDKYLVKNGKELDEKSIAFESRIRKFLNEVFDKGITNVDAAGLHLLFEQILYEVFSDHKVRIVQREFDISEKHDAIDSTIRDIIIEVFGNIISDIEGACILMVLECLKFEYYDNMISQAKAKENPIMAMFMPMFAQKLPRKENGGHYS